MAKLKKAPARSHLARNLKGLCRFLRPPRGCRLCYLPRGERNALDALLLRPRFERPGLKEIATLFERHGIATSRHMIHRHFSERHAEKYDTLV